MFRIKHVYIVENLLPNKKITVKFIETGLSGVDRCRVHITIELDEFLFTDNFYSPFCRILFIWLLSLLSNRVPSYAGNDFSDFHGFGKPENPLVESLPFSRRSSTRCSANAPQTERLSTPMNGVTVEMPDPASSFSRF